MPVIKIDDLEKISSVFRGKAGHLFANILMKILSVDKVNRLYDKNVQYEGPEFAEHILKDIEVNYEIKGLDTVANFSEGPFITISNHPYGSIDGIALVDIIGNIRPDYKLMVNKILAAVQRLNCNFITVIPNGKTIDTVRKESLEGVRKAMKHLNEGHPLGFFPSGAVSDLSLRDGCIRDREWQLPILRLIKKVEVPVIPIRFFDGNSMFYYLLGLISWKIRVLKLPSEVFNKKGKTIRIGVGNIISVDEQRKYNDIDEFGKFLRNSVYEMQMPDR